MWELKYVTYCFIYVLCYKCGNESHLAIVQIPSAIILFDT